jgi:hypothetical protein
LAHRVRDVEENCTGMHDRLVPRRLGDLAMGDVLDITVSRRSAASAALLTCSVRASRAKRRSSASVVLARTRPLSTTGMPLRIALITCFCESPLMTSDAAAVDGSNSSLGRYSPGQWSSNSRWKTFTVSTLSRRYSCECESAGHGQTWEKRAFAANSGLAEEDAFTQSLRAPPS